MLSLVKTRTNFEILIKGPKLGNSAIKVYKPNTQIVPEGHTNCATCAQASYSDGVSEYRLSNSLRLLYFLS